MKKNLIFNIVTAILTSSLLLFIILPIIKIIISTETSILLKTLFDKEVIKSIYNSFLCASIAVCIGVLIGIPASLVIAKSNFPGKSFIEAIIDIPVMIPHTAAGIALLTVYGNRSVVGTRAGIVIGMLFVSLPYFISQVKEGFKKIDIRYEKMALNFGASKRFIFFNIYLPLSKKDIVSGIIMMWARGISEFGAVVILAYHPISAPVLTYERFTSYGLKYSRPIAVILILLSLIVFSILRSVNNKN